MVVPVEPLVDDVELEEEELEGQLFGLQELDSINLPLEQPWS